MATRLVLFIVGIHFSSIEAMADSLRPNASPLTSQAKNLFLKIIQKTEAVSKNQNNTSCKKPSADQDHEAPTISEAISDHTLVPHRAKYTIAFDKQHGDEDIVDANGWLTIQIVDVGDGWTFEQNSSLIIYNSEGEGEQVNTNVVSWQDYPGNNYRFNARTLRNGHEEDNIRGEAKRGDDRVIVTYHTGPDGEVDEVTLPDNTLFPLHYLLRALKQAIKGKKVVSNMIVFDGSSETREAVEVDTVLGAVKEVEIEDAKSKKKEILKQWSMNLAIYPINSKATEPEYEVKQNVLEAGIIKDMTLDYGSFTVKAILEEIQFFRSE